MTIEHRGGGDASCIAQPGNATAIASDSGSTVFHAKGGCSAISTASNGGTGGSLCSGGKSKAESTADDGGSTLSESWGVACEATANATGAGSEAEADCYNHGSKVTAIASGGGVAMGSDTRPPQCMPNGGSAMVTSPAGDCP